MWPWLLPSLVTLLVLLAPLPLVPVDLVVFAHADERGNRATARVEWLFGLVRVRLSGGGRGPPHEGKKGPIDALAMLETQGFLRACSALGARLWRATRIREFALHTRMGLGDPADTGLLIGMLSPLIVLSSLPPTSIVRVAPDFAHETIEASFEGRVRVWPYPVMVAVVRFLFASPTRRAFRAGRRVA